MYMVLGSLTCLGKLQVPRILLCLSWFLKSSNISVLSKIYFIILYFIFIFWRLRVCSTWVVNLSGKVQGSWFSISFWLGEF